MISYSDLKNGSLNLYDIYLLNELIVYKQNTQTKTLREIKRKRALKA